MATCAGLQIERPGFQPWSETLHCVLGQDALLSQFIFPPRGIQLFRERLSVRKAHTTIPKGIVGSFNTAPCFPYFREI